MKRLIVLFAIIGILFISETAYAQKAVQKRNFNKSISIDPLDYIWASEQFSITYEFQVSKLNSVSLFTQIGLMGNPWNVFQLGASYKWYGLNDGIKPIKGFGIGPAAAVGFWSHDTFEGGTSLGVGLDAGYKLVIDNGFVIEPNIMFLYNLMEVEYVKNGDHYPILLIGINLGYAF